MATESDTDPVFEGDAGKQLWIHFQEKCRNKAEIIDVLVFLAERVRLLEQRHRKLLKGVQGRLDQVDEKLKTTPGG